MSKIITDVDVLRQISEKVETSDEQYEVIIKELIENFDPEVALGLAAPQIGSFKRIFMARLSSGTYIFINPTIEKSGKDFILMEGCLSLPNISRYVKRSREAVVTAEKVYEVKNKEFDEIEEKKFSLKDLDAAVVQHEHDHLEGTLIIDYPNLEDPAVSFLHQQSESIRKQDESWYKDYVKKQEERLHKIKLKREQKKKDIQLQLKDKVIKNNPKKKTKQEKERKRALKKMKKLATRQAKIEAYREENECKKE